MAEAPCIELGHRFVLPVYSKSKRKGAMNLISEIVQQALATGYLTLEAEEQLRQLLSKKYEWEDFKAFIRLQQEAMEGRVRQESRELLKSKRLSCDSFDEKVAIAS
jgi:hypothetical protein